MAGLSVGGVLGDAAAGAAGGAVLGPIGAAAGGLVALASDLVPALLPHLFGKNTAAVQSAVKNAVAGIGGDSADPVGVKAMIAADPAAAATLKVQLAQIAAQADQAQRQADLDALKATLADLGSARGQTVQLAQAGSPIAWGAPLVSALVLATFSLVLIATITKAMPPGSETVLNVLLGMLGTGFSAVVQYWVGSSAGSAHKNDLLFRSQPAQVSP